MLEGAYNRINDSRRDPMSSESIRNYVDKGAGSYPKTQFKKQDQIDVFESSSKKKKVKTGIFVALGTTAVAFLGAMGLAKKGVLKKFPKSFGEVSQKIKDSIDKGVKHFGKKAEEEGAESNKAGVMDIIKERIFRKPDNSKKIEKWKTKKKNKFNKKVESKRAKFEWKSEKKKFKSELKAEKKQFKEDFNAEKKAVKAQERAEKRAARAANEFDLNDDIFTDDFLD